MASDLAYRSSRPDRSVSECASGRASGRSKVLRTLTLLALGIAMATLILAMLASLRWRYARDAPVMAYTGFLIDNGAVPYRDFWDMNLPGTYVVMAFLGKVFGWSDLGFRVFDLILLAALSLLTFLWMRPSGRPAAACASVAFPLYYLSAGPYASMQREYIALLPFAVALALAVRFPGRWLVLRSLCVGLLSTTAALVKPNFAILALPAIAVLVHESAGSGRTGRGVTATAAGLLLPVAATFVWLLAVRALRPFLDIATNFWPMYSYMAGAIEPINGPARIAYVGRSMSTGLVNSFLPWALLGVFAVRRVSGLRQQMLVVCGLMILSSVYPALTGQFLSYHWLPFHYAVLCAASLTVRLPRTERRNPATLVPWLAGLVLLLLLSALVVLRVVGESRPREQGLQDRVAGFLERELRPGETVQPLDNVDGAVHGMLIVRAKLATRFVYDFNFYHHVDEPYVQRLRREFIAELSEARPAFIVDMVPGTSLHRWPKGPNTTRSFTELTSYIADHYDVVLEEREFRILRARSRRAEP